MNKSELVSKIAEDAGVSKKAASQTLDATINAITGTLSNGGDVTLPGFGSFTVKERSARKGRNPSTGETIDIKASKVPGFKAGKSLKDAVNK